ncbi:MAG: c-type cytochrome [Phaeodactylibacter xiamenensis]|uniref:Cytochrome C n=1 Tax=Phaeodactylibacter xiamenensis TaxID=1524460 RepID=A0A098S256_9BACT|nr:c-type cytochrome [Phaeodactylibacter xiamenensis]KGE85853.1 cytochrome C [Phaeodactylibacter xiamenensis]MCR9053912.1 cytochrome c [bacterium]
MKNLLILSVLIAFFAWSCSGGGEPSGTATSPAAEQEAPKADASADEGSNKGIGEVKTVDLNDPLAKSMVEAGESIYEMKCAACHKLTDQRVVGPGWAGITEKREPEWIMNMITNVEIMLAEDPTAQALLEECLVRMPNQNLSIGDARDVLEFMYANDGGTVGE